MGLFHLLIAQGKSPKGFLGKTMLRIMNSAHSPIMSWGLSKITIEDDSVILDIGCGGGKTIKMLSAMAENGKIYGIDYSEESVSTSTKENQKDVENGKVMIKQASVSSIPFSDHFFDVVSAFQTHYFWPDLENDVKEVNRVIKPKGQFVLASELYKISYHMAEFKTSESIKDLFLKSGFSEVQVFQTNKDICFVGKK